MSDTPRTDAEEVYSARIYTMLIPSSGVKPVRSKLARELERELNAAICELQREKSDHLETAEIASKEIDELKGKFERELAVAQGKYVALETFVMDLHAALGVAWGDDPYARIATLKNAESAVSTKGLDSIP